MNGSSRSIAIKKNIIASLFLKGISILVSLQVVPLTINYINPTRYGIWLTLSSIVAWLSYFDLGFAHGFRNRFAEAVAKGDMQLAREYVSTTYVVLSLLFSSVFLIAIVVNHFVDWSAILNVDAAYSSELNIVFGILAFFFCLNIVASIFTTFIHSSTINADSQPKACIGIADTNIRASIWLYLYLYSDKNRSRQLGCFGICFFWCTMFSADNNLYWYVLEW